MKRKKPKFKVGEKARLMLWNKPMVTITKVHKNFEGYCYEFREDTKAFGIPTTTQENLFKKVKGKPKKKWKKL